MEEGELECHIIIRNCHRLRVSDVTFKSVTIMQYNTAITTYTIHTNIIKGLEEMRSKVRTGLQTRSCNIEFLPSHF